jgi:hydrogenase nickel incorporation protein HypB
MCETCGCGQPGDFSVKAPHIRIFKDDGSAGAGSQYKPDLRDLVPDVGQGNEKVISVQKDILSQNNLLARKNSNSFESRNILCLNLVSSPGSGKTSLLEKTIRELKSERPLFVIEGDQQSSIDADRIKNAGAPVVQINTNSGCHLDARMIQKAQETFEIANDSILFIENVGNLVCPALFDLGEHKRVLIMSVTEGEDKPLKYPAMFQSAHLCIINKTDLLPYLDFDMETAIRNIRNVNPSLELLMISVKTGEGIQAWFDWCRVLRTRSESR